MEKNEVSEQTFRAFNTKEMETQNKNSRESDVCNIDVRRAWVAKHLKNKKQLDNEKILPANFFKESNEPNKTKQKR